MYFIWVHSISFTLPTTMTMTTEGRITEIKVDQPGHAVSVRCGANLRFGLLSQVSSSSACLCLFSCHCLSNGISQGQHRNCCKLIGVKKLPIDAEPLLLQWLEIGMRFPGRDSADEHKSQYFGITRLYLCTLAFIHLYYTQLCGL